MNLRIVCLSHVKIFWKLTSPMEILSHKKKFWELTTQKNLQISYEDCILKITFDDQVQKFTDFL